MMPTVNKGWYAEQIIVKAASTKQQMIVAKDQVSNHFPLEGWMWGEGRGDSFHSFSKVL